MDPVRGDARFWCGTPEIQDKLRSSLHDGLERGVPQLVLYGEYGTGKTHALCHCEWMLDNDSQTHGRAHCARLEWTGFGTRTRFLDLYRQTMGRLGIHLVSSLARAHFHRYKRLHPPQHLSDALSTDSDLERAIQQLAGTDKLLVGPPDGRTNLAWRWLTGHALNQSQRTGLNVAASLAEDANPSRLVKILQFCGHLLWEHQGKKLILLYDEAEQASELRGSRDALTSFTSATRALFDRSQKDVGIILAFYATNLDESVLIRPDTHSRLTDQKQVISLGTLGTTDARAQFLRRLLTELVQEGLPEYYPFHAASFAYFVQNCEKLIVVGLDDERRALFTARGDPTPRTVLVALEAVTRVAYNRHEREISVDFMKQHFPRLRGKQDAA